MLRGVYILITTEKYFCLLLMIIFLLFAGKSHADFLKPVSDVSTSKSQQKETMSGRRFFNIEPVKEHNAWDMIKWVLTGNHQQWPQRVNLEPGDLPPARVEKGIRYTVVGHATVLLQVDGINILTDPIWSMRAGMFSWVGPKRVVLPGIEFDQLPKIDVVLLSHNHYDHMDIPTLRRLAKRDNPLILTGIGNRRTLMDSGIDNVKELDWWQGFAYDHVEVFFTPARHFSRRGLRDHNMSLWGSFVIRSSSGNICFIGDSGYGSFVKEIRKRFGPVDLAFIPIGAYDPAWMMETIHLTPEEAWQVHKDLDSHLSVAIHYGTFRLTDEGIDEPTQRLKKAISSGDEIFGRFVIPTFGKNMHVKKGIEELVNYQISNSCQ